MNISIHGHASSSVYSYTRSGVFCERTVPDEALLLALQFLIPSGQVIADELPDALKDIFVDDGNRYRRNYYDMRVYEGNKEQTSYTINRSLGYREGKLGTDIYTLPPSKPEEPIDLVVWDGGLGGLQIPKNCRSVLWASKKALPDKALFEKIAQNCFLFLDADVLRSGGAMISRQISWERTVTELIWQLKINPALSYLMTAPNMIITFAEDGAVYINNTDGEQDARLVLTHGGSEGMLREKSDGFFNNTFIGMVLAAFQLFLTDAGEMCKTENIRKMLEAVESLFVTGYVFAEDHQGVTAGGERHRVARNWPAFDIPFEIDKAYNHLVVPSTWTIANNLGELYNVAFDYVLKGSEVIDGLPQLSFGAFTTIDRWEIEAYQDIRNLIIGYANNENTRPLSIAVFGSPGSGKSFGVTQIAQNVLTGKVEKLEFNVSQFTSLADLGTAFQKVRDTILGGKLPLVFFDEFDSDRDGQALGWIKSFLMPMQDGRFRDESGERPLGKCILVFAGGTASSFEGFVKQDEHFKNIKGPDFASRLRGTINILGPNPKDKKEQNYLLRRALLLRSLCERKLKFKDIAPVSTDIIRAMLRIPKYKHGARSMEAILDMSRIEGNTWEPVSLPSYSQLALHVDAAAFIDLVFGKRYVILQ